jgi:putative membrane protein
MKTPIRTPLAAIVAATLCVAGAAFGADNAATPKTSAQPGNPGTPMTATEPGKPTPATIAARSDKPRAAAPIAASNSKPGKLSRMDKDFVTKAVEANLAEAAAGKLASANAANGELKKFGDHMTQDHTKAGDELRQIAQSKGLSVPAEPNRTHQRLASQLSSLKGDKFDRVYVREAGVKAHKEAVALFTNEARKGKDPELKAFAEKTLPTIREHLAQAEQLDTAVYVKR